MKMKNLKLKKKKKSGGFQLSPDFRQRASSNASSVGRLSPIPSINNEPDWRYASTQEFTQNETTAGQTAALDQLAGSLADDLTLQNEFLQGSVVLKHFLFIFLLVYYFVFY